MSQFNLAIEQKPDLADAHYNLGGIYRQRGRLSDAAEEFKKAIQARPEFVPARAELASLLAALRDWQGAGRQYEQILKLRPGDLESRYGFVDALAQLGEHGRVITELQAALIFDKANPATYYNLGVALLATGRRHEAEAAFQEALSLKPDYVEARAGLQAAEKP